MWELYILGFFFLSIYLILRYNIRRIHVCSRDYLSSRFYGIRNNSQYANAIQESFQNQTMTLAKSIDGEREQLIYHCTTCTMSQVGERGDYLICSYCGGRMNIEEKMDIFQLFVEWYFKYIRELLMKLSQNWEIIT